MSTPEVTDITVERDRRVVIAFADGRECEFALDELRRACPCASCRNQRDQGEASWPRPGGPTDLTVTDAHLVGAWGLGLTWNDGHATGIYPWEALRRWCEQGAPSFSADSGLR